MKLKAVLTILFVTSLIFISRVSLSDEDEYRFWQKKPGVKPVTNTLYQEECGSCHFAYQPGLLPSGSWRKIMMGLDSHFSDNAELDKTDTKLIISYLTKNSAEKSSFRRSRKIMKSLGDEQLPMRITKIPYFMHEHDEIPSRLVKNNAKVASLSHCGSCHQTASSGSFSERDIVIPGYGRWDD